MPLAIVAVALLLLNSAIPAQTGEDTDWPVYGGQSEGDHYSALRQIDRTNVNKLAVAWTFDTNEKGGLQTNPLIIGRTLYAYTPTQKVIALDGATGKLRWTFDAGTPGLQPARGLSYWTDGTQRILFAGHLQYLYALNPENGKPVVTFGDRGRIDLRRDITGEDITQSFAAMTSPGVIFKDMIIVGFREPEAKPALRGDIRAYNVHTGKLRWAFHTIPHPGEPGYETWPRNAWKTAGAANNWTGMTLDAKRGIVYAPTGSAVDDFYGADRAGDDLYANCLLALDASTGKLLWHFQGVHHDIWDRDFPSPPLLLTVRSQGRSVDAVAQSTKQGYLFLFDRTSGKPLFPITEKPFPASSVPGERSAPTQPIPSSPKPFARQRLTEDMLTTRTPAAHAWALQQFRTFRSEGQFVPFSVDKQTVVFPGFDGGAEWGGSALDIKTDVLYLNANDVAWTGGLTENKSSGSLGVDVYLSQCSSCHGSNRKGSPPAFPSLIGVRNRLTATAIVQIIHNGKGRMPAFPNVEDVRLTALLDYLETGKASETPSAGAHRSLDVPGAPPKYRFTGYRKFLDPDGYPAITPPWGTLNAIDMNTGKHLWKVPLGEYPELVAQGLKNTGSENYGGPIVTAGGIVFIGATIFDHKLRAFDSHTGALLWQGDLPYAGNATPATYEIGGRQYIVIATSGQRNEKGRQGAAYVAFALPVSQQSH